MIKRLPVISRGISMYEVKKRTLGNIYALKALGYDELAGDLEDSWIKLRSGDMKLEDNPELYHSWLAADCYHRCIWSAPSTEKRLDEVMEVRAQRLRKNPTFGIPEVLDLIESRISSLKEFAEGYKATGDTTSTINSILGGDELLRLKRIIEGMWKGNE